MNSELINDNLNCRSSSIELLRLIVMFYIILHHLILHSLKSVVGYSIPVEISPDTIFYSLLNGFLIIAVNCFILISGYFGINFKVKSLIHLYVKCFSYALLFYLLHCYFDNQSIGGSIFYNSIFVFSNSPRWWFIESYLYLYLMSPLLNQAINTMSRNNYIKVLILFTILNVYFGFVWNKDINSDGYNVMNFIYLYLIGHFVKLHLNLSNFTTRKIRLKSFQIYLFLSVILGLASLLNAYILKSDLFIFRFWVYNNPILIISSVAFLLFFTTFNFQNRIINWIATSTLAIYLIHENSYVSGKLYAYVANLKSVNSHSFFFIIFVALFLFLGSILFDKFFSYLTVNIEKILNLIWINIKKRMYNIIFK